MNAPLEEFRKARNDLGDSFRSRGLWGGFQEGYTAAVDQYFRRALEESRTGERLFRGRTPFSLVAVGGYGREDLCLESDIDLLVLFGARIPKVAKPLLEEVIFPLWDLGLDLGYAVRPLRECLRMAQSDFEVLTSLLDARFIGGDSLLFLQFVDRLESKVLSKKRDHFARWLRDTDTIRLDAFGDASHRLEPDLKKGIGGLRDVHHMLWLSRVCFGVRSSRELETTGRLSHAEHEDLERSASLIRCVRSHLHDLSGRKNDRLTYEFQPEIARRLGYRDQANFQGVEQFMGDLHAAMATIKTLCRVVSAATAYEREPASFGDAGIDLPEGLGLRQGEIHIESAMRILSRPLLLMQAYEESARIGAPLSLEAMRLIREFLFLVDEDFRRSEAVSRAFMGILNSDHAADTLDGMFETRFLDGLIPEMGAIRDRVQFDTYHVFPVGRHCLETVRALKNVSRQKEILLSSIYLELPDPGPLLLAGLLHDIGKIGTDHSRTGATMAGPILERFALDAARSEQVVFLIRRHLLLVKTATRRDLGDEKVVVRCARMIGTVERLKMLYLLTWADASATGPGAWNEWIANLVQELFFKVLHLLESGELTSPGATRKAMDVRKGVIQLTEGRIPRETLDRAFDTMTPRYLLDTPAKEIARHLDLFRRLDMDRKAGRDPGFIIDPQRDEAGGYWRVAFLAGDRPGLFSDIAGVLSLNRVNILSSHIYTWANRTAVDVFHVALPDPGRPSGEIWTKVEDDLSHVFRGELSLRDQLARKREPSILSRPGRPARPAEVRVDNRASDFFTLVEVFADDRVGLLYDITRTLTDLGLDIRIARVSTKADQVADIFYVRDLDGGKVEDSESTASIRERLLDRLRLTQGGNEQDNGIRNDSSPVSIPRRTA